MASGPEHYAEAERLLTLRADEGVAPEVTRARAALAQVHATLALAAATALAGVTLTLPGTSPLAGDWNDAIGIPPEVTA